MTIDTARLPTLQGEDLQDCFVWIDWRSCESEVVEGFSEALAPEDALSSPDPEHPTTVIHRGTAYAIPLTGTGCDRYVMIHSLAEILRGRYTVWGEAESIEGSDTHGFLLLPDAASAALVAAHPDWVARHLCRLLPGMDHFSGIKVPYYGHEDHNPDFQRERAALDRRHNALDGIVRGIGEKAAKKPFWKFW